MVIKTFAAVKLCEDLCGIPVWRELLPFFHVFLIDWIHRRNMNYEVQTMKMTASQDGNDFSPVLHMSRQRGFATTWPLALQSIKMGMTSQWKRPPVLASKAGMSADDLYRQSHPFQKCVLPNPSL